MRERLDADKALRLTLLGDLDLAVATPSARDPSTEALLASWHPSHRVALHCGWDGWPGIVGAGAVWVVGYQVELPAGSVPAGSWRIRQRLSLT